MQVWGRALDVTTEIQKQVCFFRLNNLKLKYIFTGNLKLIFVCFRCEIVELSLCYTEAWSLISQDMMIQLVVLNEKYHLIVVNECVLLDIVELNASNWKLIR